MPLKNKKNDNINDDKKSNNSTSLNPEFFAERFELNDDFQNLFVCEESP